MTWPDYRRLRWNPSAWVTSNDGTKLAVEILGDTHPGPTVVFMHGWTLSSRSWHYQRMLAERYRVVLVDHRGHGESEPGPRAHRTIEQLGNDLYAVIEQVCRGRQVVVVGHSMGGMTIMGMAGSHPEVFGSQVKGVALIDTSAKRRDDDSFGLRPALARVVIPQAEALLGLMVAEPAKAERRRMAGTVGSVLLSRYLNFGVRPSWKLAQFTEALTSATPADVVGDFYLNLTSHDETAALPVLGKVPTLVVVGRLDRLTPVSHARAIAAAVPGSRLLELEGAGHTSMLEQPETINAALYQLIGSLSASDAPTMATL